MKGFSFMQIKRLNRGAEIAADGKCKVDGWAGCTRVSFQKHAIKSAEKSIANISTEHQKR
jgi:hypothetical protein